MAEPDRLLGGYDPKAGRSAHAAERPTLIPVPSLLRALLSEHLDPGYAAAAEKRDRAAESDSGRARVFSWVWQALAATLVAAVFAAAVAQARSVEPGVRTAQQLLVRSVRSTEGSAAKSRALCPPSANERNSTNLGLLSDLVTDFCRDLAINSGVLSPYIGATSTGILASSPREDSPADTRAF